MDLENTFEINEIPSDYIRVENGDILYSIHNKSKDFVLRGKDTIKALDRKFEGEIIQNVILKFKDDEKLYFGSLFHSKNHAPKTYNFLGEDLEILDSILLSEIKELYIKK